MTAVVGIDPSMAGCGIAIIKHPNHADTPNIPVTMTVKSDSLGSHLTHRAKRLDVQFGRIWSKLPNRIALVTIEDLPQKIGDKEQASLYQDRAALLLLLSGALAKAGIPVTAISPTTVKKWATGDGRAEKPAVMAAMVDLWPGIRAGKDYNRSDALAVATMGAMHLGWIEPELPCHYAPNVADWRTTTP